MTGERLGRYRLGEKLGEGGMGAVYAARDLNLDRDVAIKLLLAKDAEDPSSRRRLMREAKAASALNHPNIVTVYEAGTEAGHHFIAMELVPGQTLSQILHSRKLPFVESLRYAIQIAEALECAHASGLAHRDLKPSNVMVTPAGIVKLLDFGLAKLNPEAAALASEETLTQPGAMVGTLAYMAPEQARGEDSTPKTDIFSFGVVLYEMLTNARPFQAKSQIALFHEVLYSEPPSIRKLRAETPSALVDVVERAVRKKPEERHASMGAVAEKLRAVLRDLEAPKPKFPWKWVGGVAAVVLFGTLGIWGVRALPEMKAKVGESPRTAAELVARGRALLERRDREGALKKAISTFEEAIQNDPGNAAAYAGLADARLSGNTSTRMDPVLLGIAGDNARKAVELNPYLASAQASLGYIQSLSGKHSEAIGTMRKAADLDPKSAEIQWRFAAALFAAQRGKPKEEAAVLAKEAELRYRKAIELEPRRWEAHSRYGTFLAGRNRFAEAAKAMETARDLAPDHAVVRNNLAAVYHMLQREDDAASELQRALELRPTSNGFSNLGTLQYYRGKFAESASAFERALSSNGNDPVVWGNLADACRWVPGKKKRAAEAYARAVSLSREKLETAPQDLIMRARLAMYLAKSGAKPEAARELASLENQKIADHGALFHVSLAYELVGQRDRALAALESSLKAGHPLREADKDPELVSLRSDPRYHQLALDSAVARKP